MPEEKSATFWIPSYNHLQKIIRSMNSFISLIKKALLRSCLYKVELIYKWQNGTALLGTLAMDVM